MQMHLLLHLLLYIYIEMKGCNRDCDFGYTDFGHTDFGYALAALPDMSAKRDGCQTCCQCRLTFKIVTTCPLIKDHDAMCREEEEEVDRRWQVDKDAMREWEVFIKNSKSASGKTCTLLRSMGNAYMSIDSFCTKGETCCRRYRF